MITGSKTVLKPDDSAPDFDLTDVMGKPVKLSQYRNGFVLVVFLRYSGCPLCNLAMHRLTVEYPMLKRSGCEVIAFVQSSAANIKTNIYDRHKVTPPFPVIADPKSEVYDQYGVKTNSKSAIVKSVTEIPFWLKSVSEYGWRKPEVDSNLLLVPAMFLIGKGDQKIVSAEYGSSFYDHSTFTEIYQSLVFA